jgi:hypothetical protein
MKDGENKDNQELDLIVTTDGILEWFKEKIEMKIPIRPDIWVDAAQKLNVLLSDEHDKLYDLEQIVAKMRMDFIDDGEKINVSFAKIKVEATDEYREMRKQKAKIDRIVEQIRIAKIRARMKNDEMRGY